MPHTLKIFTHKKKVISARKKVKILVLGFFSFCFVDRCLCVLVYFPFLEMVFGVLGYINCVKVMKIESHSFHNQFG